MTELDIKQMTEILEEARKKRHAVIIVPDVDGANFKIIKMPIDKIHGLQQMMGKEN